MKRFLLLVFGCLLLMLGCSKRFSLSEGSISKENNYREVLPFELVKGKIVVEMTINGHKGRYALDTGAPLAILAKNQKAWDIPTAHSQKVGDAAGNSNVLPFVRIKEVGLGNLTYQNIPAVVIDTEGTLLDCFEIDGFIGSNLLRFGAFQVDWEKKELVIASSYEELGLERQSGQEMYLKPGQKSPFIDLKLPDGQTDRLLIDTGSDDFYAISKQTLKAFNEKGYFTNRVVCEGEGSTSYGLFGQPENEEQQLLHFDTLRLNGHAFLHTIIETDADDHSRIGSEMLEYGRFSLDYVHQLFFFEPYPEKTPFEYQSFGFGFSERDFRLVIGKVWKNTPAYAAGIRPGDLVVKVNDYQLSDRPMCEILMELSNYMQTQDLVELTVVKSGTDILATHTFKRMLFEKPFKK